jgi:hypothetical protein
MLLHHGISLDEVHWVKHHPYDGEIIKEGYSITLVGSYPVWTVKQIFISVPDGTVLPPAKVSQVFEIHEV